jgi:hypothetical protein
VLIFLEAEFRGKFSKEDLLNAFEATDQNALIDIYEKWNESYPKIWRGIGAPQQWSQDSRRMVRP